MMMMFIGTETLVTQRENERSRVHATEVPATGQKYDFSSFPWILVKILTRQRPDDQGDFSRIIRDADPQERSEAV